MTHEILIVTPHLPVLADQVRRILRNSGDYYVRATADFAEAVKLARQFGSRVALLDLDLDSIGLSAHDIGYALRQINEKIEIIGLVPSSGRQERLDLPRSLVLPRPIEPAVLLDLMSKFVPAKSAQPVQSPPADEDLPWLQDVSRAAQHLTRLTLESAAQAALITRQGELWAYAGQLSQAAARELAQTIQPAVERESGGDLLRFVRLESTEQSHMLYATRLSASMILALVFDGETPFSTIRSQAGRLAHSLSSSPSQPLELPIETSIQEKSAEEPDEAPEEGHIFPSIGDLLSDVPPPIPGTPAPVRMHPAGMPMVDQPQPQHEPRRPISPSPTFSSESSPARRVVGPPTPAAQVQTQAQVVETRPSRLEETRRHVPDVDQSLVETRAHSLGDTSQRVVVEPASAALYNLNYACLLIPRFEHHHLTGDLSDRLGEWLPQICIAYGWRLEHLSIRPDYLQWICNVPPQSSPGMLMRIVRQQTSERIFTEFARIKRENPSGDFWAPGYLIMGGAQPHPPRLVKEFIKSTRQRQGSPPRAAG